MVINKTYWVNLAIAIGLVILQVLQPFIHAHLDAEHPIHQTGFHLGSDHEEELTAASLATASDHSSLSGLPHASHIVSVASGIKQDVDMSLVNAFFGLIFSFCFVLALPSGHRLNPTFLLVPKEFLKRRLPAPRAPPKF